MFDGQEATKTHERSEDARDTVELEDRLGSGRDGVREEAEPGKKL